MDINRLEQLLAYDSAVRGRANKFGARAFVYGDRALISEHLPDHKPSGGGASDHSATGGALGGGSGKKKNKNKQKPLQLSPDADEACSRWNFYSCGSGSSCSRKHVCFHCHHPDHKAKECVNVKRHTVAAK